MSKAAAEIKSLREVLRILITRLDERTISANWSEVGERLGYRVSAFRTAFLRVAIGLMHPRPGRQQILKS